MSVFPQISSNLDIPASGPLKLFRGCPPEWHIRWDFDRFWSAHYYHTERTKNYRSGHLYNWPTMHPHRLIIERIQIWLSPAVCCSDVQAEALWLQAWKQIIHCPWTARAEQFLYLSHPRDKAVLRPTVYRNDMHVVVGPQPVTAEDHPPEVLHHALLRPTVGWQRRSVQLTVTLRNFSRRTPAFANQQFLALLFNLTKAMNESLSLSA